MKPILPEIFAAFVVLTTLAAAVAADDKAAAAKMRPGAAVLYISPPKDSSNSDKVWQRMIASHAAFIGNRQGLIAAVSKSDGQIAQTKWFKEHKSPAEAVRWLEQNLPHPPGARHGADRSVD